MSKLLSHTPSLETEHGDILDRRKEGTGPAQLAEVNHGLRVSVVGGWEREREEENGQGASRGLETAFVLIPAFLRNGSDVGLAYALGVGQKQELKVILKERGRIYISVSF